MIEAGIIDRKQKRQKRQKQQKLKKTEMTEKGGIKVRVYNWKGVTVPYTHLINGIAKQPIQSETL